MLEQIIAFFTSYFSTLEYVCLGILCVAFIYEIYFYLRYMAAPLREERRRKKGKTVLSLEQPGVSVIVCAKNEAYNVETYLMSLLEQNYPLFEVIVVNDGSEDNTEAILKRYATVYDNLHLTFVPKEARVGSTKKLAITLAAKAAKYDILLLTDADCRPQSPDWIAKMMEYFTAQTEVVLGYGAYFEHKTAVSRLISYDTLFNGMQYMGMALAGKPYMGVGRNLAYRKSTFFDNKGFVGTSSIKAGDDDLFVNRVANRLNTRVATNPQTITWSVPKPSFVEFEMQKERHLSVSPHYKLSSKIRLAIEPLMRALFYGSFIWACSMGNMVVLLTAVVCFILRLILQLVIINKGARQTGQRAVGLELVCYDIFLPLNTLYMLFIQMLFPRRKNRW